MSKPNIHDLLKTCCYGNCQKDATTRGTVYGRNMEETVVSACDEHAKLDSFFPFVDRCKSEPEQTPYSEEDYADAKAKGLDLDDWDDYVKYYEVGEREEWE